MQEGKHISGGHDLIPCEACHDGVLAVGVSPTQFLHQPLVTCVIPHLVLLPRQQWITSCHNGTNARDKSASHIASTSTCESCQNTITWIPATAVDHSQILGACESCHNGAVARGKGASHITTSGLGGVTTDSASTSATISAGGAGGGGMGGF